MTATAPRSPARADAVDRGQVARFTAECTRLWPAGDRPGVKLGLAVSGGPDSLALLLLASAARPGAVEAATVDHGLRPEAAAEAEMVAELCARLGVPHRTLAVRLAPGNLQDQARRARYDALGEWARERGAQALATAHHADDQAETVLMRLNRASGLAGLAGIRARGTWPSTGLTLFRPLLGWRKAELKALVASTGLIPAQDPSNADPRFDRARLRDALATADWLDPAAIARSASHLAEAEEALDWATRREWDEKVRELDGSYRWSSSSVPRAVQIRVVQMGIEALSGEHAPATAVARLVDALDAGGRATLAGVLIDVNKGLWTFHREPPRRGN